MLKAYFDESQRSNGLLCVAGYIFAPQQARKLTTDFKKVFGHYGGFHMKDLVAKKQGYKDINDDERHKLMKQAVGIVRSRFRYGVVVTVDVAEYEAIAPAWIRGFKKPYPFLCHMAMTAAAKITKRHGDSGPISYTFEAGHAHEAEARHAVHQMSKSKELREAYLYWGDDFLPKADAVPLQAADLLAWEAAKFKHETVDGLRDPRMSLVSLFGADPTRYQVAFCGGESLAGALRRYQELGLEQLQEEADMLQRRQAQRNARTSTMADEIEQLPSADPQ